MLTIASSDPLLRAFLAHAEAKRRLWPARSGMLVAISGGCASTALAVLLASARTRFHFTLSLGHLADTPQAEAAVRGLARTLKLPLHVTPPLPTARSTDELAEPGEDRCEDLRKTTRDDLVATGHTRDRREEHLFLQLLLGSDTEGLILPEVVRQTLVRPLLPFSREECRAFLERHGVAYDQRARLGLTTLPDRLRLLLMPLLRHHFQLQLSETLEAFLDSARDDAEFLLDLAAAARDETEWRHEGDRISVNGARFRALPAALRRRLLRDAVSTLLPQRRLALRDLLALDSRLQTPSTGAYRPEDTPLSIEEAGATLLLRCL